MTTASPSELLLELSRLQSRVAELERLAESRNQALAILDHTAAEFRMVVENASDAILMFDSNGCIRFANPRCRELFELPPAEMIGRSFRDFVDPAEHDRLWDRFLRRLRGEKVESRYEARLQTGPGRKFWGDLNVNAVERNGVVEGTLVFARDITARKCSEAALQYRVAFEALITSISTQFINLPLDEIEPELDSALERVGSFAGVDRSYIFSFDAAGRTMSNVHEWCAPGIASQIARLQSIPLVDFAWFARTIREQSFVHIPAVSALPPEAETERAHLLDQGIQSVVVVPMHVERSLIGFVGFDSVRTAKHWSDDAVSLLRIVGEIFASAIARQRAEAALRIAREELEGRVAERTAELHEKNRRLQEQIVERRVAEANWRSLVEHAPDVIMRVGPDGRILFVSRDAPPPAPSMLGMLADQYAVPEDRERVRAGLRRVFETGEPDSFEVKVIVPDGSLTWYQGRMGPVRDEDRITSAIIIAADVTSRRRAEELARQHLAELAHAARLCTVGEMAAELTHELSQPLGAIANYANGCIRHLAPFRPQFAEVSEILHEITVQAERASEIIRSTRNYVKKREPQLAPTDINTLVREVVGLAEIDAARKNVTLQLELAESLPVVPADRIQIEQVILNLVLNGIDEMQQVSTAGGTLRVVTQGHRARVRVAVIDQGRGISDAVAQRLYEPFFTTKPEGLGVGLSICRSIIQIHGGRLWAVNNPTGGSTFQFTLPCSSGHSEERDDAE